MHLMIESRLNAVYPKDSAESEYLYASLANWANKQELATIKLINVQSEATQSHPETKYPSIKWNVACQEDISTDLDKQPHIASQWAPSFRIMHLDLSILISKRAQMLRTPSTRTLAPQRASSSASHNIMLTPPRSSSTLIQTGLQHNSMSYSTITSAPLLQPVI